MIQNVRQGAAVFISPPCLIDTLQAELERWRWPVKTFISTNVGLHPRQLPSTWILPDTQIHDDSIRREIGAYLRYARSHQRPVTLFVDEAQRYVNLDARRTRAMFQGLVPAFDQTVYLSGTPMPNRPIELYPILSTSAPETIDGMDELSYAQRFCGAYLDSDQRWVVTGASNLEELQRRIYGRFMLRVRKADVADLPPKTEEVVYLKDDRPATLRKLEEAMAVKLPANCSDDDLVKHVIAAERGRTAATLPLSTYRKELGLLKTALAVQFIRDQLENTDDTFLVFANHTEVIENLARGLDRYRPIVITGKTRKSDRQPLVDLFQKDPTRRLFLGNYLAAGIGLTLTKANRNVFVEYSWVPADNDQAVDRAHRYGQERPVHTQYLAYRNSLDARVLGVNIRKRGVTAYV